MPQEDDMKELAERIQQFQAEERWDELARMLSLQRESATTPDEFMLCSVLEMGYRYLAGQHDIAKDIIMSMEKFLSQVRFNNAQFNNLVEGALSFGYFNEAEEILTQALKLAIVNKEPKSSTSHYYNEHANILASTNRLEEARLLMEAIKKETGTSRPPLAVSHQLVTEDAQFVEENGKIMCKLAFKKNVGFSVDSPKVKKNIFQKGYTLKCSFENPERGQPPFVKNFTNQTANSETFPVNFEYPKIKKGNYLIEIEYFENDEQMESVGHHLMLCQSQFDK